MRDRDRRWFAATVQSHYRAAWIGFVIGVRPRSLNQDGTESPILTIVIVRNRRGNVPIKRIVRVLDASWVTPVAPRDLSMIPAVWFAGQAGDKR